MLWYEWLLCAVVVIETVLLVRILFWFKNRAIGTIRVDNSLPDEGPYLFLELTPTGYSKLEDKSFAIVQVDRENFVSRK